MSDNEYLGSLSKVTDIALDLLKKGMTVDAIENEMKTRGLEVGANVKTAIRTAEIVKKLGY